MDITPLLTQLYPLLEDAASNLAQIEALVGRREGQDAEYEVLRSLAGAAIIPLLEARLSSPVKATRVEAVRLSARLLDRSSAHRLLRRAANDPSAGVRTVVLREVVRTGMSEVALPFPGQDAPHHRPYGGFPANTYQIWGWFFGTLFRLFRDPDRGSVIRGRSAKAGVVFPDTVEALAAELGLSSVEQLRALSRPGSGRGAPYVSFRVPKRSGGERTIHAPRAALRRVQRAILERYLAPLPLHPSCHGFVKGRSILTNASPHAGAKLLIKTDIEGFFPAIHFDRVAGLFRLHGASVEVARQLARLTTHVDVLPDGSTAWPGALPQGAPTSPALANLTCGRLDARLSGLARRFDAVYTRYADDLSFSFRGEEPRSIGRFFWWVNAILQQEGFAENASKRKVLRATGRQTVTGLVVNERARLSRDARRKLRAMLHQASRSGVADLEVSHPGFGARLLGHAAHARSVEGSLGEAWLERARQLVRVARRCAPPP